jgi:hypothetical protein
MSLRLQKQDEFLRELSELSRKYNISIIGCGCCGSPGICEAAVLPTDDITASYYTVDPWLDHLFFGTDKEQKEKRKR